MNFVLKIGLFAILALLTACDDGPVSLPSPHALNDGATGTYCGMILVEHAGPKAQVFEKGRKNPIWFSAVRDALAYSRLPGEAQSIVVLYVHDMGRADSWEKPQMDGIWIEAQKAHFVVGSSKRGGMGMVEVVPFGTQEDATAFAGKYGGKIMTFQEVPSKYLFPDPDETVHVVAND